MLYKFKNYIKRFFRFILNKITPPNPHKIHFLHIGKTGGSAIRKALKDINVDNFELVLHSHDTNIKDIRKGEKIVFFLRNPISRFISGFYSRKRKGQPRYNSEWNDIESTVFSTFDTPNALVKTLLDKSSIYHPIALTAMKKVQHLNHFNDWLISEEYLKSRAEDIFFVGYQESLNMDFEKLIKKLKITSKISLPTDDVGAHRNPGDIDKSLDEKCQRALEEWYKDDVRLIRFCMKEFIF